MAINIKKGRAEEPARKVRGRDGRKPRSATDLAETLMAIGRRCSALPDLDTRDADEILGYEKSE